MAIPFIPLLAILGIAGGIATLVWYDELSPAQREEADRLALRWFGKRFNLLNQEEQEAVRKNIS